MSVRVRQNQFADFGYLFDQMERIAQEMRTTGPRTSVTTLPVDVYDRGDELIVQTFVPGVRSEHLDVQIDDGVLTISGNFPQLYDSDDARSWTWYALELRTGAFQRSISLPYKVELASVEAHVEDGVLRLVLPKAQEAKPHRIQIGGDAATTATPQLAESMNGTTAS
jgi:HSP20 family protein